MRKERLPPAAHCCHLCSHLSTRRPLMRLDSHGRDSLPVVARKGFASCFQTRTGTLTLGAFRLQVNRIQIGFRLRSESLDQSRTGFTVLTVFRTCPRGIWIRSNRATLLTHLTPEQFETTSCRWISIRCANIRFHLICDCSEDKREIRFGSA